MDLNREWQDKLEKSLQQAEQKFERKISELKEENLSLKKQLEDNGDLIKSSRQNLSSLQSESENLKQELEDFKVYKEKFERLQAQALAMKERFENRVRELLDAEPDPEVIGEEVKKLMNAMYKKLKVQIKPEQYYSGNGILTAMLRIIKMVTLQLLNSQENQEQDEEVDYFSQHIYKAPEVIIPTVNIPASPSPPVSQAPIEASSNQPLCEIF